MELDEDLKVVLKEAITICKWNGEEEGGFILKKDSGYKFVKIDNGYSGQLCAAGLYIATPEQYGLKVITLQNKEGYIPSASFHTHPDGCGAWPSSIDLKNIFRGFPINFIYAPSKNELVMYNSVKEDYSGDLEVIWHASCPEVHWSVSKVNL